MIVDLPEKFSMEGVAVIENRILKIMRYIAFSDIMYELTYQMKGRNICGYCKKEKEKKKMTLDHMYPQELGGPTIPNNLLPCCKKCNRTKGNLTSKEFRKYLKKKQEEKEKYLEKVQKHQEKLKKKGKYHIPIDWIEERKVSDLKLLWTPNYSDTKYKKVRKYYEETGMFKKIVIVDRNNQILSGAVSYIVAKKMKLKTITVIPLENVELTV